MSALFGNGENRLSEIRNENNQSQLNDVKNIFSVKNSSNKSQITATKRDFLPAEISKNVKSPFLPRLPKKLIQSKLNESHLINDFYVEPDETNVYHLLNIKFQIQLI